MIKVSLQNGWTKESVKFNLLGTSIYDLDKTRFSIYPNPGKEYLHISTQEIIEQIEVINISGEVVLKLFPNTKFIRFKPQLSAGVYVIRLHTNSYQSNSTLIMH